MCTLEKFNKLCLAPIPKRHITLQMIDKAGNLSPDWVARLPRLGKHEQYRQIKIMLGELIVADVAESVRLTALEALVVLAERLILHMQTEYVNNLQNSPAEQKNYIDEVRSLYFLLILAYQTVAFSTHQKLDSAQPTQKGGWIKKVAELSANMPVIGMANDKKCHTIAVYRIMSLCAKLLPEFALTYQKIPASLWQMMNSWYLKAATLGIEKFDIAKFNELLEGSIHTQYLHSCSLSFVNFFAYRRSDILNMCKILPEWVEYVHATFKAESHFRAFVNLQSKHPPELITPFASINPYSSEYVCLFFDVSKLIEQLQKIEKNSHDHFDNKSLFEARLAKMVLLALHRQMEPSNSKLLSQSAQMLTGFGAIYKEIAGGQNFNQVIAQNALPQEYHPKLVFGTNDDVGQEQVKLIRRSDAGVRFVLDGAGQSEEGEEPLTRPYLPVFGLFAMMSPRSQNQHPWRLGIVHWAEPKNSHVEVDGQFLGRILSACGVRLSTRDMRSQDFAQALLLAGDELNERTTLVLPRYHFKVGDVVILRVGEKQTTLRLEQNLLSTDDIEQYEIVRLAS